ncbi:uncharacterized protein LOC142162196 [Nicotiana tabacum]|uniref:Uncharacterized protein LOC142162196 n=1 Tax=Nicotiana tabacum TaxID=4097 RepID=A0AC58RPJ8_TOBAC
MLNKGKDTEPVANSATTGITGTLHAFISTLVDNDWIVDTGASNHMVHCLNLLDFYEEVSEKDKNKVQLPTGEQDFITHTGICSFFRNKKIQNILHILDFKYNLLSASKITKELRCLVEFFPGFYVFQELFSGKVLGIGREELGLYILKAAERQTPEHHTLPSVNTIVSTNKTLSHNSTSPCNDFSLWHRRLGHALLKFKTTVKCLKTDNGTEFVNDQIQVLRLSHTSSKARRSSETLSRDVVFKEDIFPFKHMQLGTSLLFPILEFTYAPIEKSIGQPVSISYLPTYGVQQMSSPSSPLYGDNSEPIPSIPPSALSVSPEGLRISSRPSKPPIWLGFSCCISAIVEPRTFKEASSNQKWIEVMQAKISALQDNNTWSFVDLPQGKVPIGCKWVFKVKYKSNGEVKIYKARLVAKGYSQQEGLDYTETFSHMAKMVTVRAVVALNAASRWYIFQMDVHNAFLQGDLIEEVYMQVPDSFSSQGKN